MNNNPILVFDSGIGSYSVIKEMLKVLPNENIIYLADRKSYPYGTKTREELLENTLGVISFFEKNYAPKLVVLASNTPSIQILDDVKKATKTPIFGVFPPLRKASEISQTKKIAVLATKGAVESEELNNFIEQEVDIKSYTVVKINASPMVSLIEPGTFLTDKQQSIHVCKEVIDSYLEDTDIDVMTFSSTHLPFLRKYLEELYPNITFIDPADNVSVQIQNYLETNNLSSTTQGTMTVLGTQSDSRGLYNKDLEKIFHQMGFQCTVEDIEIPGVG